MELFFTVDKILQQSPVEQHVHTNYTDGNCAIEEIINLAVNNRFGRIAFTEHVQRRSDWYSSFIKKIHQYKKENKNKIKIITGLEAKQINFDGDIDATTEQKQWADIVIGSVHGYCKQGDCNFYEFKNFEPHEALEYELSQLLILIKNHRRNGINVLGHPFGAFIKNYGGNVSLEYWEKVIKEITVNNLALDLNYRYHRDYFNMLINLCRKYGSKINLGSDVHATEDFGKGHSLFVEMTV